MLFWYFFYLAQKKAIKRELTTKEAKQLIDDINAKLYTMLKVSLYEMAEIVIMLFINISIVGFIFFRIILFCNLPKTYLLVAIMAVALFLIKAIKDFIRLMKCNEKDEPYFLLRGQDICSLPAIEAYCNAVKNKVKAPYFIEEIEEIMKDFRAFREEQETHIPD